MTPNKNKNDGGWSSRWTRILLWTLVFPALVTGAGLGAYRLWQHIRTRPEFMVDASAVSFRRAPPCVKRKAMLKDLRWQLSSLTSPVSIFKSGLPRLVATKLKKSPWVKEVHQVERQLPNRLITDLDFREPAGIVSFEGGQYLVSADGHWLPQRLYRVPEHWTAQNTPPIVNDNLASNPRPGGKWGAPATTIGARLCAYLRRSGALAEIDIKAIDVTKVGPPLDDSEVVLVTAEGVRIRWGSTDSYQHIGSLQDHPNYTSNEQKLQKLLKTVRENPQRWIRMKYLDLRYRNKVFYQLQGREEASDSSSRKNQPQETTTESLPTAQHPDTHIPAYPPCIRSPRT